jgi:hypothetical protein
VPAAGALLAIGALLLGTAALAACRRGERAAPEPPRDEIQTVDVAPPPDARVDPSTDRQERRRAETFSGVMPPGYPASLPLPTGASLVDQGPRWVEVLVGRPPGGVREEYLRRVAAAGWRAESDGADLQLRREGRTVRTRLSAAGPSTRLRIEY